ncbi:MAG: ribonuclease E/G, partial [bacterium]
AKDFMRMIMPSHAKVVQPYADQMPLFARFQVESYLGGMFNPTVQLKSGGYIVIGVTEALVAIDVNSGRATKEGSIEDTALKTNLEAAEEIARQLRLRDLAGLIVIDFIDMEERRNNLAVEKKIKDKLKTDRARIQVGRISGFGLLEMSRQRLRPGMLESTTQPCAHCHGTGLIRSDDSLALQVLRALEEEGTRKRTKEVLLKAPVGIINFLFNQKREHLALIEARYGMSVRLEADPSLISPDYAIEKFKTATRIVPEPGSVISGNASLMGAAVDEDEDPDIIDDIDDIEEADDVVEAKSAPQNAPQNAGPRPEGDGNGTKKKRRRRRKKKPGSAPSDGMATEGQGVDDGDEDDSEDVGGAIVAADVAPEAAPEAVAVPEPAAETAEAAPKKRTRAPRGKAAAKPAADAVVAEAAAADAPAPEPVADPAPAKKPATRARSRAKTVKPQEAATLDTAAPTPDTTPVAPDLPPEPEIVEVPAPAPQKVNEPVIEIPQPAPDVIPEPEVEDPTKPKRKGWWSLGR